MLHALQRCRGPHAGCGHCAGPRLPAQNFRRHALPFITSFCKCSVPCHATLRCAVLCCAVLCCAVLCCAVLCWPPSDAVLAGFSESAAAVGISSNSNGNLECYSTVYVLANSHARKQRHAKGPAHRCRSLHLAKAVLMLCRGLCPAL